MNIQFLAMNVQNQIIPRIRDIQSRRGKVERIHKVENSSNQVKDLAKNHL